MAQASRSAILATGLAMFSMFFGAGNVVFPLALGQIAQDKNFFAILGMLITAVGVPFTGLLAMTLFDGDYDRFFGRIGKVAGFIVAAIIMGLIGPFGATPRCVALSYSTVKTLLPNISLPLFSAISCVVIWLFTFRRNTIIDLLGYVLTPVLLGSLAIIIIVGLFTAPAAPIAEQERFALFLKGLQDGYQTMDLLGAFFFSSVAIVGLKSALKDTVEDRRSLLTAALKASAIGAFLLALIYVGFSYVAAFHSEAVANIPSDELISKVAVHILGPHAAIIACIAVAFACLTTAIALSTVFAEFIQKDIFFNKIGYGPLLIGTLVVTFFVSILNFTSIIAFLAPILRICYPALIVLSVLNILYKLYNFKPVKIPVFVTFLLTLVAYF